jgi:PST family polysaccharide transporter
VLTTLTGLLATAQNASGRPWERLAVTVGVGAAKWTLGTWAIHRFGLSGIGPVGVAVGLAELGVTAWLVARLNPALRGLVAQVVEPFVSVGLLLALAWVAALALLREGGLSRALVGAVLFAFFFLVRERLPGPLPLLRELHGILDFVRARRAARVAAAPVGPAT